MEFIQNYKRALIPIGILVIAIAIYSILVATKPVPPLKEVEERSWPVAVQSVQFEDVRPLLNAFGEIRAGREAELRAQVSGTVIQVHDDLGDGALMRTGEVLVTIDDFDYVATRDERLADLAEAEAKRAELESVLDGEEKLLPGDKSQVGISMREVERQQKLLKRSAVSRKSYDDALTKLNDRKQNVLVREQNIARIKTQITQAQSAVQKAKTALQKAQHDVEDTKLQAPFDGFLSETDVTEGKQVSTSDRLGRLISLDNLEVSFHISEADYARLTRHNDLTNRKINVLVQRGKEQSSFEGQIIRIDARVDAATGGRRVFAGLSDLTLKTDLRPGLFVEVIVPDELYRSVVSLPKQALHDQDTVYLVKEGRLHKQKVTVAAKNAGSLLISQGLEAGDQVCITRFAEMGQGLKVDVK